MKTFREEAEAAGLKKETIQKLCAQDIDTLEVLGLMSDDHVSELELSRGQSLLLQKWVASRRQIESPSCSSNQSTDETTNQSADGPTNQSAGSSAVQNQSPTVPNQVQSPVDAALNTLLNQLESQEDSADQSSTGKSAGKPLLIVDHINQAQFGSVDPFEREVCTQGGAQLVLRASRQKPLPEQVSLAQWVGANARIMEKMVRSHQLQSPEEICAYLNYTAKFSDYAQVMEIPSVMIFDHEYRKRQAEKSRSWDEDDFHLSSFYLKKKEPARRDQSYNHRRSSDRPLPVVRDMNGLEICKSFNTAGCFRDICRYSHACLICKTRGHSRLQHRDNSSLNPQHRDNFSLNPQAPPFTQRQQQQQQLYH